MAGKVSNTAKAQYLHGSHRRRCNEPQPELTPRLTLSRQPVADHRRPDKGHKTILPFRERLTRTKGSFQCRDVTLNARSKAPESLQSLLLKTHGAQRNPFLLVEPNPLDAQNLAFSNVRLARIAAISNRRFGHATIERLVRFN